jgi:hypothetical protein
MRDEILEQIRRLAQANGGKPPGSRLFEAQSGIRESDWRGRYWARWGDAVSEAGLQRNTKRVKFEEEFVLTKLAQACRHYGKMPTAMELRMYNKVDGSFPGQKTISQHFGTLSAAPSRLAEWARAKEQYLDIAAMLEPVIGPQPEVKSPSKEGLVYLIRSGPHYKIGRSDQLERRVKEIRIALPEAATLVHSIRTDDPAGIEAYWHRRFADRRANGEWFKLTGVDVAAFKRRRFQ